MSDLKLASRFPAVTQEQWAEAVMASLRGRPFESLKSFTLDGVEIEPVYPHDPEAPRLPVLPERTSADAWTVSQRIDIPDISVANEQALRDLENGATGLSLVLPGAVTAGAHGVCVHDAPSLEALFHNIEPDLIDVRLDGGRNGRDLALLVLEAYRARGLDLSRCRLDLGLDPFGALALNGQIVARPQLAERAAEIFNRSADLGHAGGAFCADARVYHGAGAAEAQELALALATAVGYLRLLEDGGVDPVAAAPRVSMVLSADADQFLTIAKFRAARFLWARVLDASGIERSPLTLHAETSARMMARHDPHVNLLRTTSAAFAAGCGGADGVSVLPFTQAIGLADEFARRMARNIQSLLLEETRAGQVLDPAAGAGYAEALTRGLADQGWQVFQSIEAHGGILQALSDGVPQALIAGTRAQRDQLLATRKMGLTGVSEFPTLAGKQPRTLDISVDESWSIGTPWSGDMVTCEPLKQTRVSAAFEALRDAADAHLEKTGSRPAVFLATLGTPADFTVRATWMRNLLAAGGIDAVEGGLDDYQAGDLKTACICSSDELYATEAEPTAKTLKKLGCEYLLLAGKPGNIKDLLEQAGIDEFVHAGRDVVELLSAVHAKLGVNVVD